MVILTVTKAIGVKMKNIYVKDLLGENLEEEFMNFDLTEIQKVLSNLQIIDAIDLPHAEALQQQALRGADILSEYLAKIVKTVSYLEGKINSVKNKVALEYKAPDGSKTTSDMKLWASGSSPEVDDLVGRLAKAKATKLVLEKKFDILIRQHHYYKDIANGLRKTILGYTVPAMPKEEVPEGWE